MYLFLLTPRQRLEGLYRADRKARNEADLAMQGRRARITRTAFCMESCELQDRFRRFVQAGSLHLGSTAAGP